MIRLPVAEFLSFKNHFFFCNSFGTSVRTIGQNQNKNLLVWKMAFETYELNFIKFHLFN